MRLKVSECEAFTTRQPVRLLAAGRFGTHCNGESPRDAALPKRESNRNDPTYRLISFQHLQKTLARGRREFPEILKENMLLRLPRRQPDSP